MKTIKIYILFASLLAICIITCITVCNLLVLGSARDKMYNDVTLIPYNRVGVLLGTNKYARNGRANVFYNRRIEACVRLYEAGKIERILISGDNSRTTYDEPTSMKQDLIACGVPEECVYLDYAGFRTFDSMVRAKKVFGLDKFTIISQAFHNERALYIAQCNNIDAVAYNAADVRLPRWKLKMVVREWLARVNAVLDVIIDKEPHFLGEIINIE